MTEPTFTVLLPVHRPPALLPYAIASVQAQTCPDFELFVICDGAPAETASAARAAAAADPRIRVFEHPKGERHGEAHRHLALLEARGRCVCQIADDDLWLPNHLSEMELLLRSVDFGHISAVWVFPEQRVRVDLHGFRSKAVRQRMIRDVWNFFGPTTAGYRLSAYRSLSEGWVPGPRDVPTDLYMWRKFLMREDFAVGTRYSVTSAHFATAHRRNWPLERRQAELAEWAGRLADPIQRDAFIQAALADPIIPKAWIERPEARKRASASTRAERELARLRKSFSWRITRPLRKIARWLGWKTAR